jgi:DNA-binding transcriptional LysR family regulator
LIRYPEKFLAENRAARDREWTFAASDNAEVNLATLAPRLRSSNTSLRRQAAIAGLGVVRMPAFFGEQAVSSGELQRLLVNYPCSSLALYALVPAIMLMPKKARLFLDELDRHIKQTA